jgi:hypothetical protein
LSVCCVPHNNSQHFRPFSFRKPQTEGEGGQEGGGGGGEGKEGVEEEEEEEELVSGCLFCSSICPPGTSVVVVVVVVVVADDVSGVGCEDLFVVDAGGVSRAWEEVGANKEAEEGIEDWEERKAADKSERLESRVDDARRPLSLARQASHDPHALQSLSRVPNSSLVGESEESLELSPESKAIQLSDFFLGAVLKFDIEGVCGWYCYL